MRHIVGALALAAAACGHRGLPGYDTTITKITLSPAQVMLTVPLGGTTTQVYQVTATDYDGMTSDITTTCTFTVDMSFGTFAGATLTALPQGGKTLVTAACGALSATAEVDVVITGTVVGSGAPANAAQLFGSATAGSNAALTPVIQYPLNGAVSPRNIPSIETQWSTGSNDLFHVHYESSYLQVDAYTTDVQETLAEADWEAIANSAAGDLLQISLEGLVVASPATKYVAQPVSLTMSQDTIDQSAIYYWASSQGNLMTQTFGVTTAPDVVEGSCTACHSVSRTATRIGYCRCVDENCGLEYVGFLKYDTNTNTWNEQINANNEQIQGTYTTFAPVGNPFPDDTKSIAIVTTGGSTFQLYDPDTGSAVPSNISVANVPSGSTTRPAIMPYWSAGGSNVVYVSASTSNSVDLDGGTIMTMGYQYTNGTHTFATPKQLVPNPITLPNGSYENFFFPSYSPDDSLVVFDAARAAWRNFTSERTAGQRLMLAAANGSWYVDLTALDGGAMTDADITWAHWAPTDSSDYLWLVFSSEADYGHEVTLANTNPACVANGDQQCKQIWIGAIAKNKLTGTMDPSAPPMWLPGQSTQADNISPYWSLPAGIQ
jgi:hypothetical protein